ncbi:MAG TPA: alkaline phosphatase family protein [Vicinamibacterales bacterium]|nr:alkaline phosphatase family protein [Acidobacteriota bacterium]HQX80547.1 alkaline phosphatase family protein [Vicinamibacterales bacterium]
MLPPKVLMLGLDSASATLVRRWTSSGALPNLRLLEEEGVRGVLRSPPGLGDDATWASFYTCTAPGAHGRYYFHSIQPASYELPFVQDAHLKREPFWNVLDRAGRRVAVIDVPKVPPSRPFGGLHLTDWRVHGRDNLTRSTPPELAVELSRRFGEDRTDRADTGDWLCRMDALTESELPVFLDHLLQSIEHKTTLAEELMARERWDLFLLVYKEAHCAGHQCWHLVDPMHPAYSRDVAERLADPLLRIYQALDRAVGQLRERLSPDTLLIVFSDLDMGPNYTAEHILDDVLIALEKTLWPPSTRWRRWYEKAMRLKNPSLPRHAFRPAFQLEHNEISGAVRLNVRGREPFGVINPGAELEAYCTRLTAELMRLVNPATGGPIVGEVIRCDRLYHGENTDKLPDLLVVWNRDAPIESAHSPALGSMPPRPSGLRTGNHLHNGFCLAVGPGLAKGAAFDASITDLGPTVAHRLGVTLPRVDGRPIPELVGSSIPAC